MWYLVVIAKVRLVITLCPDFEHGGLIYGEPNGCFKFSGMSGRIVRFEP